MERSQLESLLAAARVSTRRTTTNAVNVCCPFCSSPDTNYHCGIFVSSLRYNCWRCRSTGSLRRLLVAFGLSPTDISRALAGAPVTADHTVSLLDRVRAALGGQTKQPPEAQTEVELPPSEQIDSTMDAPALWGFLARRRISIETCRRYDARWGGNTGNHTHRIVLPVYGEDGRLAAWQSRDTTGHARTKYLTGGRTSETLYWTDLWLYDRTPHRTYVVEGVFDAWRMGKNTVATFTHAMSQMQRRLLLSFYDTGEIVIAWDADSYNLSMAAARSLAPFVRAGAVRLPDGEDPDSLGRERIMELEVRWA